MKKIYKKYINFIESLPGKHHFFKMFLAENLALLRKKKLISSVKWSREQEEEFNQFWKFNYKKIKKSGNKLFESFNGVFHSEYIPDFLYATKIESKLNSYKYARIYSDKSLIEVLYKGKSTALIPQTFLLKAGGVFYDKDRKILNRSKAKDILSNLTKAVIKPIIDGNSGKGVIVGDFDSSGYDKHNNFNIFSLLEDSQDNYIVQEKIIQSKELNQLYSKSINTFRVITYIANSSVNVAPVALRIGSGGGVIDNIHAGGLVVGVNIETEKLLKDAYKLGYSESKLQFQKHPDTGICFENFKIDGIKSIVDAAIALHGQTPHIGIISWDFTLNQDNIPVLIEANFTGQSVWFSQIVHGKPFFEHNTKYILSLIKK